MGQTTIAHRITPIPAVSRHLAPTHLLASTSERRGLRAADLDADRTARGRQRLTLGVGRRLHLHPATYLAAAILNGEFPLFPREAKQPVLAYSIGSVVAGIFTANVGATLRAARTDALAEQQLQHEVSRARAEQEIAQIAFDTWKESLADIQQAVVRQLRPADALQLLRELDAELSPDLGTSVTARGTVEDVVSRAANDHAISVELNTTGPIECTLPSLQAVYLVTQSALSNVRRHSGTSAARVTYQAATDSITLTIEDAGSGPAASREKFNEHHALGHTQEYLRGLDGTITIGQGAGGGTTVSATWRTQ